MSARLAVVAGTLFIALGLSACTTDSEPSHESSEPSHESETEALSTFYYATNGPDWTNSDSWLTDTPVGDWYGVVTDDEGRVVELNLRENELSGEIPPELDSLTNLDGEILPELGALVNLTYLDLAWNELTGSLPQELRMLNSLEKLDFRSDAGLCAPNGDAFLTWLEGLTTEDGSDPGPICAAADSASN